jgi:feruloyl esterase
VTLALLGGAAPVPTAGRCRVQRLPTPPGVELVEARQLAAGPFVAPDGTRTTIPETCRIRGIARPTRASRIAFELWLPATGWNGRYYQLGNGGFAGNIHLPSLAAEAARGNAAASTDTGHSGTGLDASWAAGQPEKVVDYGHRSIKATSDAARSLIAAYYGRPARHRYYAGCSNGGRQALMAAARYPDDWDGILAGAPANPWTVQLAAHAAIQHQLRASPDAWLSPPKLSAIQRAALATCPREAGVIDGVAGDPRQCRFEPSTIQCRGAETNDCLTDAQVQSVRVLQQAGYEPTAAAMPGSWGEWVVQPDSDRPSQLTFATEAMRYLAGRPQWTSSSFTEDDATALRPLSGVLDARADELTRFRARGGRIISYFGWADPLIAPRLGTRFYAEVAAASGGFSRARSFYRLFMVPGMGHCQGGAGPTSFGQSAPAPAAYDDARHDVRRALEVWVEKGTPPETIVAAQPGTSATRKLQPFRP